MIEGYNCVYNEADKAAMAALSGYQYKTLRYLSARASEINVSFPTAKEIAGAIGCHERHVWRCLNRLLELGYIGLLRHGHFDELKNKREPNVYQISLSYRRVAPSKEAEAQAKWDKRLYDSQSANDPNFGYGRMQKGTCHGSHDKESTTESVKESIQESEKESKKESTTTAPQAAVDLPLNKGEARRETLQRGITAGAQALRAEAANAAENQGEGQDKAEQPESRKKPATRQPIGQKNPTPHSPPPAGAKDDETQEATSGYFEPPSITTPLEATAEALATRLYEIGIPHPLGRALIQHYGFFDAEQALLQTHAAMRAGIAHTPSGLYRHILQKPRVDPGVEKNTKRRRTKKAKPESEYTGGKYAGIIES